MSLTRNDREDVIDSLQDLDSFSSHPSREDDLGIDLEHGKRKAKPDLDQTLNRASGNALSEGSKPSTLNSVPLGTISQKCHSIPQGSLPLANASKALTLTEQDDSYLRSKYGLDDSVALKASTEKSVFQSPLTLAVVLNTLAKQGLNDLLANKANAGCVNVSNVAAQDVREHVKASNARTTNVPSSKIVIGSKQNQGESV